MTPNVLLMLSTDQPPDPAEEMRWHAKRCSLPLGGTIEASGRTLTRATLPVGRSSAQVYYES